ncbi:MAG: hypothetical protein V4525_01985 [Pseudomonadota bacterium]
MKRFSSRPLAGKTIPFTAAVIFSLLGKHALAAVTDVTLKPNIAVYHGNCPAVIKFTGTITVDAPGTIDYQFTRSDGAIDTNIKHLSFAKAGTLAISTTWTLGGPARPHIKGWQAVKTLGAQGKEFSHADFEVFCDPPLNSAKAAHGNTDWHIDTANEFLFGKDMGNHNTAANFAPSGWTKTHIHTGLTNTAHFYNDKSKVATGEDTDTTNGIDKPMLFFYAGHGNATTWNTLGDNGHQTNVLLSDVNNGGQLRYFWQCSCEVFAHGPNVCSGGSCDYSSPEGFDGSADSATMRNVFERWGPAISENLRMACGVSTLAYCHEGNVNAIWDNYNNKGYSVADSFIDGLGSDTVKPLCITRGGSDITKTPLYDETFTNARNSSGNSHLHIIYASGTQTKPAPLKWKIDLIPLKVFRVRLSPPGDPIEFKKNIAMVNRVEQFRDARFAGGMAVVRRNAESGAIHLRAVGDNAETSASAISSTTPPTTATATTNRQQDPEQTALHLVRSLGWLSNDQGTVRTKKLLTASMPEKGKASDIVRGEKGTQITFTRHLPIGRQTVDTLGRGGRIDVIISREGSILAASRTWRTAQTTREEIDVKPFASAQAEALKQLNNTTAYTLADWRFGYKEESANVRQRELAVVYQFDFVPKKQDQIIDFPPRSIEISAAR